MSLLHTVNKSPFEKNSLQSCLEHALSGSAVLLIEDGVYGALDNSASSDAVKKAMPGVSVFAMQTDLDARGIDTGKLIDGVEVIGYDGFVDLAEKHDQVQSWL